MHRLAAFILMSVMLTSCATVAVTSAVVGTGYTATKYAVKGTVGAGKLVYRGTKAAVKGTARLVTDDDAADDELIAQDRDQLPDAE